MAASVLGKRSRRVLDAEEHTTAFLSRKRVSRPTKVDIYEDAVLTQPARPQKLCKSAKKEPISRATRRANASQPTSTKCSALVGIERENSKLADAVLSDYQTHDENVLSVEETTTFDTPTAIRFKNVLYESTPSTPRHRVRPQGVLLTPRTPRTIGTPQFNANNVFASARQAFSFASEGSRLIGREHERQQMHSFVSKAVESHTNGCLYISGPPGTGKSALVQEVLLDYQERTDVHFAKLNCTALRTPSEIFEKLVEELTPDVDIGKISAEAYFKKLVEKKSKSSTKSYVVMLDEIDSLLDTSYDLLYKLFDWALRASSSLVLIGIANALDLTDRFLPRLRSRSLKPTLLPFMPYTAEQISTIVTDKLRSLLPFDTTATKDFVPLMQPAATKLVGKKIGSQTGDLRKAFGLVRRAIGQLEQEAANKRAVANPVQPLGDLTNSARQNIMGVVDPSPLRTEATPDPKITEMTFETAPRVTIAHVARLASSIFGNGTATRLSGLNLQQKAVLCSLVGGEKKKHDRDPFTTPSKSANKTPTVKELFAKYSALCSRDEGLLQPLRDTEFRDVVNSLETLGLVHEARGRTSSLLTPTNTPSRGRTNGDNKQMVSAVSEKEMRDSLNGSGADLLRRLLEDF